VWFRGNKHSVFMAADSGHLAIFARPSTSAAAAAIFVEDAIASAPRGIVDMEHLGLLIRSTSSRIRRRLALIADIAAASLPLAGA
jgi:hypothetical protein